jgi:hypothetical protein
MASLTAHLRSPEDHGRLGFHPECPLCRRERSIGPLGTDTVLSRRSHALLAAGVLAFSSAPPTVVHAQEPDYEQEGTTAPEQVVNDDPRSAPDYDPGGQSTELPLDVGPAPDTDAAPDLTSDVAPLEQEQLANEDVPTIAAEQETGTAGTGDEQLPSASELPPVPAASGTPAPAAPSVQAPSASAEHVPAAIHQEPQPADDRPSRRGPRHGSAGQSRPGSAAVLPAQTHPATAAQPLQTTQAAAASASPPSQEGNSDATISTDRRAAHRGDRFHVVQRGESLWSIAKDLLGNEASVAAVAREVNRLWGLNKTRIGTGDPDLLMAGTKLVLR